MNELHLAKVMMYEQTYKHAPETLRDLRHVWSRDSREVRSTHRAVAKRIIAGLANTLLVPALVHTPRGALRDGRTGRKVTR